MRKARMAFWSVLGCTVVGLINLQNAQAYVRTLSSAGVPLRWPNAQLTIELNPNNIRGLSSAQVASMMQNAFNAWSATNANVGASVNTSSGFAANTTHDSANRVYFSSQSSSQLDYGVIAVTNVWYYNYGNPASIVEVDMTFNDNDFVFTANPGDTNTGGQKIYLQDVATHEAGHAFGLDHSTTNKSALIYRAFSGQYALSNDDSTAVNTVYPGTGGGSISGYVSGTRGGMFGSHVLAIDAETGRVQAGTLAEPSGAFSIGYIPAGNYVVMAEPFYPSTYTISEYYLNVNHYFCGGKKFQRTFYGSCGNQGAATIVSVGAGNTNIGTVSPSCTAMGNPGGAPTSIAQAKTASTDGGAYYGTMSTNSSHYYKLNNFSGNLNIKAMSWTLFSPLDVKVEILNADGSALAGASSIDNVESPMPGGKINYDASATVANLATGNYLVRVYSAATMVGDAAFPATYEFKDAAGFYLLLVNANNSAGTSNITDMAACLSVNNTVQGATAGAPSTPPKEKEGIEGGCGSLALAPSDDGGPGGPPFYATSLFLILATAILTRLLPELADRRRRR